MTTTESAREPYKGEVARIRDEMIRERAVEALAGISLAGFDSCEVSQKVLRRQLFTPPSPWLAMPKRRPWALGTPMVTSVYHWEGLARVLNDRDVDTFVEVWTRKPHRAWRMQHMSLSTITGGILRGEIKDAWDW